MRIRFFWRDIRSPAAR